MEMMSQIPLEEPKVQLLKLDGLLQSNSDMLETSMNQGFRPAKMNQSKMSSNMRSTMKRSDWRNLPLDNAMSTQFSQAEVTIV